MERQRRSARRCRQQSQQCRRRTVGLRFSVPPSSRPLSCLGCTCFQALWSFCLEPCPKEQIHTITSSEVEGGGGIKVETSSQVGRGIKVVASQVVDGQAGHRWGPGGAWPGALPGQSSLEKQRHLERSVSSASASGERILDHKCLKKVSVENAGT